jgi:hypothetical protein
MTAPVHKLAQLLLYETVHSALQTQAADDVPFQLDDVDNCLRLAAFGGTCRSLRYKEEVVIKGVTVAAESAGRTLGGAMWSLSRLTENILYASAVALGAGDAVPPCGLSLQARRSRFAVSASSKDVSLLVTTAAPGWNKHKVLLAPPVAVRASDVTAQMDAVTTAIASLSASAQSSSSQSTAASAASGTSEHLAVPSGAEALASTIREVWRQKGNVLVAADSGARLLETMLNLERSSALGPASEGWVAVLSTLGPALLGNAAALRDWTMAPPGENPFKLSRVRVATTMAELGRLPPPGCVIASTADLESGFARQLLPIWAADARNAVILTTLPAAGSLGERLLRGEAMRRAAAASGSAASVKALHAIESLVGPLPALPSSKSSAQASKTSSLSPVAGEPGAPGGAAAPADLEAGEDSFQARFMQLRKRELTGQDRADWEAARAARAAAEARQQADAARRRMAEDKARTAAAEEAAAASRAAASAEAAEALTAVDAVVLDRAVQARARLGMSALPREAVARAIADSSATCPDGASTLAGRPLTATFGGLEALGSWSALGEAIDLSALRESDKAEDLRRAGLATSGGKASLLGQIAHPSVAAAAAAAAAGGAGRRALPPSEAVVLAARLSRPDLGGTSSSSGSASAASASASSSSALAAAAAAAAEAKPEATELVEAVADVKCRLGFLDLSGRSQRAAVAEAVVRARPKRVVVIGGAPSGSGASKELDSREATAAAITAAVGPGIPVLRVADGATESLGSGAATRTVRLAPELFTGLVFEQVGAAEVALVRGVCAAADGADTADQASATGSTDEDVAVIMPEGGGEPESGPQPIPTATAFGAIFHGSESPSASASTAWNWRLSGYAEEDEDEAAMLVALGDLAGAAHNVPAEPRSVLALRSGQLPLRTIHRAVTAAGRKPSLQPGAIATGNAAVLKSDQGITLVGVAGEDWDAISSAIHGLTAAV